jgi:hypothetical protein
MQMEARKCHRMALHMPVIWLHSWAGWYAELCASLSCRDRDGRFTLEELLAFASFAHSYARQQHTLDSSYMAAGLASLRMWRDMRQDSGREQFVDWCVPADATAKRNSGSSCWHSKHLLLRPVLSSSTPGCRAKLQPVPATT